MRQCEAFVEAIADNPSTAVAERWRVYDFILTKKPSVATLHSREAALDGLGYLFIER